MDGWRERRAPHLDHTADPIAATWLGRIAYRDAWALQKRLVNARAAGGIPDTLLLLEHDAVLTLGRNADEIHVLASPRELRRRGVEVLRVERGGEVTYHGPGQLVAYPILRLGDRGILIRPLVRALEDAMIGTCAALGVQATRRDGHPGCWVMEEGRPARKIGALGIRIEHGVSYHGIALNIDPDLRDFELIDPCGLPGLVSTSIAEELGRTAEPPTTEVVRRAAEVFAAALGRALGAGIHHVSGEAVAAVGAVGAVEAVEAVEAVAAVAAVGAVESVDPVEAVAVVECVEIGDPLDMVEAADPAVTRSSTASAIAGAA